MTNDQIDAFMAVARAGTAADVKTLVDIARLEPADQARRCLAAIWPALLAGMYQPKFDGDGTAPAVDAFL